MGHSAVSKRVSRKGAGGAKEDRKGLNATRSLRAYLSVFAPLRETSFVFPLFKFLLKNPATNPEDAVFTLLEGQKERRGQRKRIVKNCGAAVTNQISRRIIVR
jgi:hypothetical protein